ncbi:NADP-dependent oxidoreductase domain-containing protein [Dunaliella salina]|uniref:NADP-dependent oxidoreductase domain-containing protein n=1 Tax=Dunaliella salina TaxID=3046 RepID=A0ABQ7GG68_DUNSA|nr:NADP-dependent oxidoreductase domain-containing protein [Dunaliella salina]|eukprot:KAF5833599.1 NADP-dependent oxidoreductase domain-containing protein [Dunaliella salina]
MHVSSVIHPLAKLSAPTRSAMEIFHLSVLLFPWHTQVLDAAYDLGVRYFDAARSYGMAEDFLSSWLAMRGLEPIQCLVGSKWRYYYTAGFKVDTGGQPHEIKDHSRSRLNDQSAKSKQLLGSHLDLYQIHSATLKSGVLQSKEVLGGLEQLNKEKGWRIGLSLSGPKQADTLRSAQSVRMSDGQPLFSAVQATWNLLEQSAGDALLEAKQAGMDVIIKEGLANGRLAGINPDPGFASKQTLLSDVAQSYDTTVDALALAVVISQPFKPMVLSGACTVHQLRSNMQAIDLASRLREQDIQGLQTSLKQNAESYWGERSALPWN